MPEKQKGTQNVLAAVLAIIGAIGAIGSMGGSVTIIDVAFGALIWGGIGALIGGFIDRRRSRSN